MIDEATEKVKGTFGVKWFDVAVVSGSGMTIFNGDALDYVDVPGMPHPFTEGHSGRIIHVCIGGVNVLCFEGRFHYYEGRTDEDIRFIPFLAYRLGCRLFIVLGAAGAVSERVRDKKFVVIRDHINISGRNPLTGLVGVYGSRVFFDPSSLYNGIFTDMLVKTAVDLGIEFLEGVIGVVHGPSYETPSEVKMLSSFGVDVVNMSFCHEAVVAGFLGMQVSGVAVVTNVAGEGSCHSRVVEIAGNLSGELSLWLSRTIYAVFHRGQ